MGNRYEADLKINHSIHKAFEKTVAILAFLCWDYRTNGEDLIIAQTPISAFGWGEELTISFDEKHHMSIVSESRYPFQVFDMGKNESNVDKFLSIFKRAKLPFNEEDFVDEKPRSWFERFFSGR